MRGRRHREQKVAEAMAYVRLLCREDARIGLADLFLWRCFDDHPEWVDRWPCALLAAAALDAAPRGVQGGET